MIKNLEIKKLLESTDSFKQELIGYIRSYDFVKTPKSEMVIYIADILHEHSNAISLLIKEELFVSCMSVFSLQSDVLVRLWWFLFVATDSQIEELSMPLTNKNFLNSNNMVLSTNEMLDDLEKKAPVGLHTRIIQLRQNSTKALSSFVHNDVHAIELIKTGFPINIILNVLKQSNNVLHMSYTVLAIMENNEDLYNITLYLAKKYPECLQFE